MNGDIGLTEKVIQHKILVNLKSFTEGYLQQSLADSEL